MYGYRCDKCGAYLDPGEHCSDCEPTTATASQDTREERKDEKGKPEEVLC